MNTAMTTRVRASLEITESKHTRAWHTSAACKHSSRSSYPGRPHKEVPSAKWMPHKNQSRLSQDTHPCLAPNQKTPQDSMTARSWSISRSSDASLQHSRVLNEPSSVLSAESTSAALSDKSCARLYVLYINNQTWPSVCWTQRDTAISPFSSF